MKSIEQYTKKQSKSSVEGYKAFFEDLPLLSNPYRLPSKDYRLWIDGWTHAEYSCWEAGRTDALADKPRKTSGMKKQEAASYNRGYNQKLRP